MKRLSCLLLLPAIAWASGPVAKVLADPICLNSDFTLVLEDYDRQTKLKQRGHLWLSQAQHRLKLSANQPEKGDWLIEGNRVLWIDHSLKQVVETKLSEIQQPILSWLITGQSHDYTLQYQEDEERLYIRFIPKDKHKRYVEATWQNQRLIHVTGEDNIGQRWTLKLPISAQVNCPLLAEDFYITIPDDYDRA